MNETYGPEDSFNEYNDVDATACVCDYNTFEDNEVFHDHEGDDCYAGYDHEFDDVSDDNWAYGTLDVE